MVSTLIIFLSGYFLFLNDTSENSPLTLPYFSKADTPTYDSLNYISALRFPVDLAPKSLTHSKDLTKVYVLCLEALSVIEIDAQSRKRLRTLKFKPTEGLGFDYTQRKWIKSIQEKPVESYLTHNDRYLWISLHNADGVCVWDLNYNQKKIETPHKIATIIKGNTKTKVSLPFYETETTPKYIAFDSINNHLFISNWHDNSLSIFKIDGDSSIDWSFEKHIPTKVTPRGILIDNDNNTLWVGNMASHSISIYNLKTFDLKKVIKNVQSPRHLVLNDSLIIISQSSKEIISTYDRKTFKKQFELNTKDDPRSLAISKNGRFLFSTSYADNLLEVFDLKEKKRLYSLISHGGPVGITLLEKGNRIDAWVCNYKFSTVKVFTFEMK